jgi:hypothetical protein
MNHSCRPKTVGAKDNKPQPLFNRGKSKLLQYNYFIEDTYIPNFSGLQATVSAYNSQLALAAQHFI